MFSLSTIENSKELARRGLRGLKGFLSGLNLSVGGDEGLSLGVDAEAGLADSGSIEADLPELILAIAEAAKAAGKPVAIFLDELQYLEEREFSALIMAVHRVNQRSLPLILVGAGLPQIRVLRVIRSLTLNGCSATPKSVHSRMTMQWQLLSDRRPMKGSASAMRRSSG